MEVNPRNIKYAERYLGEIQNRIATGEFHYLSYFPSSKKAALFGHEKKKKTVKDYLEEYLVICENRNLYPRPWTVTANAFALSVSYTKCV